MAIKHSSRRQKGRNLQQWTCQKISDLLGFSWGPDELIASREASQAGTDVRLVGEAKQRFPFSVECKAHESWAVPSWIEQAQQNQEPGTDWLLVAKRSRKPPVVIMDAGAFFKIMERVDELRSLDADQG